MALDRFVNFKDKKPTVRQLKILLEDYLNGAGEIDYSKVNQKTLYVVLPGKPSFPFRRMEPKLKAHQTLFDEVKERWFEVCFVSLNQSHQIKKDKDSGEKYKIGPNIDVITRLADEYTNIVAAGFAELVARYYQAELD